MMPFRKPFKGQSGEDDRKSVIKQMKVRANIKSDKSWIHKPDDTEGKTIELPPSKEQYPTPPPVPPMMQKDKSPAPRPSSGYIIRGIFTKPVDSTPLLQSHHSTTLERPKRTISTKYINMSEDESTSLLPADEQQKRSEGPWNVLRKSATWGRSYVISAAKKTPEPAPRVLSLYPPPRSSAQESIPSFIPKRDDVEDEDSSDRSEMTPSLARQVFGFSSSSSSKEGTSYSDWAKSESKGLLSSPREQESRSSAWSSDSNHGSTGSQNDVDEVEITSKKKSSFNYREQIISSTQEGHYEGSDKQQSIKSNEPRYASVSPDSSTEHIYGVSANLNKTMPSEFRRSLSSYGERSVTTIVGEAGWKNAIYAGATGGVHQDPNIHYSEYHLNTPETAKQMSLSGHDSSSKRCISTWGESSSMGSMVSSSQDGASALDKSAMKNETICTYCCNGIISGPKIILEHLGICCHEACFKCGVCNRAMGNMLNQVYIHNGIVHCVQCYSRLF